MNRRGLMLSAAMSAGLAALPRSASALGRGGVLRVGLTAVVIREYARMFNDLRDYLTQRMGRPVAFVQRRTYADIMDLLGRRELDAAWICGYPYVQPRAPEYLDLLVTPIYRGSPLYRSLLIVPADRSAQGLEDLRGGVFAYSDPDSNSGYLTPRVLLLEKGYNPDRFFRFSFFTYSHDRTINAVADKVADGGAVDSYVYDILERYKPAIVARTRVIGESRQFGFPPIVVQRDLAPAVRRHLLDVLTGMMADPDGKAVLDLLGLDGFAQVAPSLYDAIRAQARKMAVSFAETVSDTP